MNQFSIALLLASIAPAWWPARGRRGKTQRSGARRIGRCVSRVTPAAVTLMVCAALPVLAYASPPDPVWIQGLYDDADYDDVVGLVVAAAWNTGSPPPGDLPGLLPLIGAAPQHDDEIPLVRAAAVACSRAPPTS
jgi:hypothetical protein